MAHYMAINKSGKNLPIFSGWPSVDKGNQIGTIYNREVFIYGDTEDGVEVYFRNSSGRIVQGFYYATDANGNDLFSSNAEAMKALSSCIDYPFSTVIFHGDQRALFEASEGFHPAYSVSLDHMMPLNMGDLMEWEQNYPKNTPKHHPLDYLYKQLAARN